MTSLHSPWLVVVSLELNTTLEALLLLAVHPYRWILESLGVTRLRDCPVSVVAPPNPPAHLPARLTLQADHRVAGVEDGLVGSCTVPDVQGCG